MITSVSLFALVVRDYDEAIQFYCEKLGFKLIDDTDLGDKRWVRIQAPGKNGSEILLSRAVDEQQLRVVGNQAGGRVLFFLHTDNFQNDYEALLAKDVRFLEVPRHEVYGSVVVMEDLYGNRIDLIQPK